MRIALYASLLALVVGSAGLAGTDWPQFRGPDATGVVPGDGVFSGEGSVGLRLAWNGSAWTLPDFDGLSVRETLRGLQGTGLEAELEGSGRVVAQSPPAGARLRPGEKLKLTLAR